MSDFYRTQMGHTFFEGTMPAIARSLTRIAEGLERMEQGKEPKAEDSAEPVAEPPVKHLWELDTPAGSVTLEFYAPKSASQADLSACAFSVLLSKVDLRVIS